MKENKSKALKQLGIVFLAIIVINLISNFFFKRFDLTQDKRYTLSETTAIGITIARKTKFSMLASILAMQHQLVPPTINHVTEDPTVDNRLNLTLNQAQSSKIDVVLSNGFGFGGHNATVIFRKI